MYHVIKLQLNIQAGRHCGSLNADNRHLESNTKLIGRPVQRYRQVKFPRWHT